jgi:hypothetical protein
MSAILELPPANIYYAGMKIFSNNFQTLNKYFLVKIKRRYRYITYLQCTYTKDWFNYVIQSDKISLDDQKYFVNHIFKRNYSITMDIFSNVSSIELEKYMICKYAQYMMRYPEEYCSTAEIAAQRFYYLLGNEENLNDGMNGILSKISPDLFQSIVYDNTTLRPIIKRHIPVIFDKILYEEHDTERDVERTNKIVKLICRNATDDITKYFEPLFSYYDESKEDRFCGYIIEFMLNTHISNALDNQNIDIIGRLFYFAFFKNQVSLFVCFLLHYSEYISRDYIIHFINQKMRDLMNKSIEIHSSDVVREHYYLIDYAYNKVIEYIGNIIEHFNSENQSELIQTDTRELFERIRQLS